MSFDLSNKSNKIQMSPLHRVGPGTTRCTYKRLSSIQYRRLILTLEYPNSEGNRYILNKDL
jgi:hypothetical protein